MPFGRAKAMFYRIWQHFKRTGLMAHHREALASDEGRPTDQPT